MDELILAKYGHLDGNPKFIVANGKHAEGRSKLATARVWGVCLVHICACTYMVIRDHLPCIHRPIRLHNGIVLIIRLIDHHAIQD